MSGVNDVKWYGEFDELADTPEGEPVGEQAIKSMSQLCEGNTLKRLALVEYLLRERKMVCRDIGTATFGLHGGDLDKVRRIAADTKRARANRYAYGMAV